MQHPVFASIFNVITELNLSTHPFRNRTTPYLLSAIVLVVALLSTIFLLAKLRDNTQAAERAEREVAEMREEVAGLKAKGDAVQQQLSPEQREVLVAAHKLVDNKKFGWSRLFADLENVIPGTVSASRITVENIYRDGDRIKAELDFGCISRDYQAVMGMIGTMNASGVFQAELREQNLQTSQKQSYSEFTLHLIYTPAYGRAASPGDLARVDGGAGQ